MRSINVSTAVFAAIWAQRENGEETETEILARLLKCEAVPNPGSEQSQYEVGFYDSRNGVSFPAGFEILRRYKGSVYKARALDNCWLRSDDNKRYPSLNQLNQSIVAGQENVWNGNWFYMDNGVERPIANLRG